MLPAKIPSELQAAAPELGRRLGVILAALAALIARAFLRHPSAALIIPLWRYLTHTARRFDRLMAHIAAGHLPRKRRPDRAKTPAEPRAARLPGTRAWLITALRHEAAAYASQLQSLLAEPEAAGLLAAHPAAGRLLRPLCHMLGLDRPGAPAISERATPPPPSTPKTPHSRATTAPAPPSRAPRLPDPRSRRAPWPWFSPAKSPA